MAHVELNRTATPVASRGFADLFGTLVARFERYRKVRETIAEMSALSDRELKDLGLSRSEIRRLALEAASEH